MTEFNAKIEEHYGVKYVGYYDIPGRDNVRVFYQPNPNKALGHSNYMGVLVNPLTNEVWICNAKTIEDARYNAIYVNGKYLVSRYRHDFQTAGHAMIDGGLDYAKYNPNFPVTHKMRVVDGQEVFEEL